ncbi:hypothetical protein AA100600_2608 [Gluconobacter thailandicus F149-1 = NBRC 100600]|nr:hypothetical protein AA100600_2608 [Gluconobacter thailandicus F149-1 = NBRC 100600]
MMPRKEQKLRIIAAILCGTVAGTEGFGKIKRTKFMKNCADPLLLPCSDAMDDALSSE